MKVFITRNITATDFFKVTLEKVGCCVSGQSLIEFSSVSFDTIPPCDWLFFYSKKGVQYFFNQLNEVQFNFFRHKKIGTIGGGTARFLEKNYQLKPNFIGTGEPLQTAKAFAQIAASQKVLFLRARKSKQSIQKQLSKIVQVQDLVVYDNQSKQHINVPEVDILVFTSPLNVQTYFRHYSQKKPQTIIAIGNTTAKALYQLDIKDVIISESPTKQSLVKAVLSIMN